MSTAMQENEIHADRDARGFVPDAVPDHVEVRRNAGVAAAVGLTASAVAIAYFGRATQTGVRSGLGLRRRDGAARFLLACRPR